MMYKHRNMLQCYKKQILLIYIVHLLNKYSKILQNIRYIHPDVSQKLVNPDIYIYVMFYLIDIYIIYNNNKDIYIMFYLIYIHSFQLKSGPCFNMSNLFTKIYNMLYYTTNLYLK
jgi:hypothetical protein